MLKSCFKQFYSPTAKVRVATNSLTYKNYYLENQFIEIRINIHCIKQLKN